MGSGTFDALWLYTFLGGRGISSGRNGFDVVFLQRILQLLGFYTGRITGYYDAATQTAVRAFQASAGILAQAEMVRYEPRHHLKLASRKGCGSFLWQGTSRDAEDRGWRNHSMRRRTRSRAGSGTTMIATTHHLRLTA